MTNKKEGVETDLRRNIFYRIAKIFYTRGRMLFILGLGPFILRRPRQRIGWSQQKAQQVRPMIRPAMQRVKARARPR